MIILANFSVRFFRINKKIKNKQNMDDKDIKIFNRLAIELICEIIYSLTNKNSNF